MDAVQVHVNPKRHTTAGIVMYRYVGNTARKMYVATKSQRSCPHHLGPTLFAPHVPRLLTRVNTAIKDARRVMKSTTLSRKPLP